MMQSLNSEQPKLPDRYSDLELLASSDRSSVYRGFDAVDNGEVAIKIFDRAAASVFMQETSISLKLDHPGLVSCLDSFYTPKGFGVIVFQYLKLGTLADLLNARGTALTPTECMNCLTQLLEALNYLHRKGWVHSDIKPENIFLDKNKDGSIRYVLGDVGSCCRETDTLDGTIGAGTPAYSAPEITFKQQSCASDLYSLGILGFQIFVGHLPFIGSIEEIQRLHLGGQFPLGEVSDQGFREILAGLTHKDPKLRLANASHALHLIAGISKKGGHCLLQGNRVDGPESNASYIIKLIAEPLTISHHQYRDDRSIIINYGSFCDIVSSDLHRTSLYSPLGSQWDDQLGVVSFSNSNIHACNPTFRTFTEVLNFDVRVKTLAYKNNRVFWADDYHYYFTADSNSAVTSDKRHQSSGSIFRRHACIFDTGFVISEGNLNEYVCLYDSSIESQSKVQLPGPIVELAVSQYEIFAIVLESSKQRLYSIYTIDAEHGTAREVPLSHQIRSWSKSHKGIHLLLANGDLVRVNSRDMSAIGATHYKDISAFSVSETNQDYALLVDRGAGEYLLEYHSLR